jgi:uncharacterized protein YjbI with pentapeptide repeats
MNDFEKLIAALPANRLYVDTCGAQGARIEMVGANLWGANLRGADLRGVYLSGANLWGANLEGANLRGANLRGANLWGANLWGANLEGANLRGANLRGANLANADLAGANLSGANLADAYLSGANLRCAKLEGADLRAANLVGANLGDAYLGGANLDGADLSNATLPDFQLPEGTLTAYKLCNGILVTLEIPAEAKRTASLVGPKCRAEFAIVRHVDHPWKVARSSAQRPHNTPEIVYMEGATVLPDRFDDDIRVECTHGVHFYRTKEETLASGF